MMLNITLSIDQIAGVVGVGFDFPKDVIYGSTFYTKLNLKKKNSLTMTLIHNI